MIITVEEARRLMGEASKKYTDKQIEEVINVFDYVADMSIDCFLVKRKEKLNKKLEVISQPSLNGIGVLNEQQA